MELAETTGEWKWTHPIDNTTTLAESGTLAAVTASFVNVNPTADVTPPTPSSGPTTVPSTLVYSLLPPFSLVLIYFSSIIPLLLFERIR